LTMSAVGVASAATEPALGGAVRDQSRSYGGSIARFLVFLDTF